MRQDDRSGSELCECVMLTGIFSHHVRALRIGMRRPQCAHTELANLKRKLPVPVQYRYALDFAIQFVITGTGTGRLQYHGSQTMQV